MDPSSTAAHPVHAPDTPSFRQLISVFGKIGLLSFGGPAAQVALMHRVLVDEHRWLDERRFLSALSFCMLLPGPEAMQLATYSGWRLHGVKGGLAAGLLFVAPGALLVLTLSILYGAWGHTPPAAALFTGNQLDSDQDGNGNACDADFNQSLPVVGFPDLTQMRQALGKDRDASDCPQDDGSPGGPCAEFDLDGNLPVIGFPDLVRFRQLLGSEPGPKCQACPLPNLP